MTDRVTISNEATDRLVGSEALIGESVMLQSEIALLNLEEQRILNDLEAVRKKIRAKETQAIACLAASRLLTDQVEAATSMARQIEKFYRI